MTARRWSFLFMVVFVLALASRVLTQSQIGSELSIARHLPDGEEFAISLQALLEHGKKLFTANWTSQEGGGRPLTKGNGTPLSDRSAPLVFPRNFNRVSAPDANSCAGCHNVPFGIAGGGGDIVANVFVLGQRFDFATFGDVDDGFLTKGTTDEGVPLAGILPKMVTLQNIANSRNTLGMFGSGFIELLAREITSNLQAIRDTIPPGGAKALTSKGISFGVLSRAIDGSWITSGVEGLSSTSLKTTGPADPPNLIIRPFHQAGAVVSVREFSNNAFNHHHGIQTTERFRPGEDPDVDGFVNEMTRADVTAVSVFQATLAVPGRVIPNDPDVEAAVLLGEKKFSNIGCATCHIPSLSLQGSTFTEPNPFNPPGNLRPGDAPSFSVDLTSSGLPSPRLKAVNGVVDVPAFTDLKLHDICAPDSDPNAEPLDMHLSPPTAGTNRKFLTRKLWGTANEPPFFHHGQFTTLREAILAHSGEALRARERFERLPPHESDAIVEFLKTLQVLPPGTRSLIVDENGNAKAWPPRHGS
jgi:hypothetical protein